MPGSGRAEVSSVTIAVPFYSGLTYLSDALESVVSQSSPDWRLLVIDDSGELEDADSVRELVTSFADARMESRRNPQNLGMVDNWNRCIDESESDLVTLLHADDRLLPRYVELMLELASRHPRAAALYCRAAIIGRSGRRTFSTPDLVKRWFAPRATDVAVLVGEPAATALMRGNFIMCPTLCFRRSVLGRRRFTRGWSQVQDLELSVRLLMDGESLVGSSEVAYAYRRHPASATAVHSECRLRFDEEFRLFDQVAERATELGWESTADVASRKRIVKLHLLYRAARDLIALRIGQAAETLRYLASHRRSVK
jgi:glycosyltransferase involved in cell wall biosynthesis